jgi:tetratricopeptide (TPR) repeat protein
MNEIDPQLKKDFSEAQELTGKKKYHESIEKYELILKKYPNLITAINNIGLNYEHLGLLDKSIHYYKLCCDKAQKEKVFLNNLGNVYYKQKDYLKAITIFDQSYNINNKQEEIIEKLGYSLMEAKLNKKAELFLRDVLKVFPNNAYLNSLMGYNLLSLNFHKEGLNFIKKGTGFIEFNNDSVNIV